MQVAREGRHCEKEKHMKNRFGQLLRLARRNAGKTLKQLSEHLQISAGYVSKVERGLCPPFREHKVVSAAEFLGVGPEALLRASTGERPDRDMVKPETVQTYALLLRRLNSLNETDLADIQAILRRSAAYGSGDNVAVFHKSSAPATTRRGKERDRGNSEEDDVVDGTYGRSGHAQRGRPGASRVQRIPTNAR
jgi:transcriptional regulator with XRE-family HTH domain